jgi:hypothetical protein
MNAREFAAWGLTLSSALDAGAALAYLGSYEQGDLLLGASYYIQQAEKILADLAAPEVAARMEHCELLQHAVPLPDYVPLSDRDAQYTELLNLYWEFRYSPLDWVSFFQLRETRIHNLWEEPERRIKAHEEAREEKERREKKQWEDARQNNLAEARRRVSGPQQEAPCFATTRKNGLNCNRSTLVRIQELPSISSPERTVTVFVQRCSECWQIYKEIQDRETSTKKLRDCFLKSGESDAPTGLQFTSAEAEEFARIDFGKILCPFLYENSAENNAPADPKSACSENDH